MGMCTVNLFPWLIDPICLHCCLLLLLAEVERTCTFTALHAVRRTCLSKQREYIHFWQLSLAWLIDPIRLHHCLLMLLSEVACTCTSTALHAVARTCVSKQKECITIIRYIHICTASCSLSSLSHCGACHS